MKFNEKLIMLRKQNNLSQEQLGEKLEVARQTISKWELGETTPEMDKLIKLSEIFSITVDELVKDEKETEVRKDPNNTNTQKLAGMTIRILKGIGIFLIVSVVLYVALIVIGIVTFNVEGNVIVTEIKEEVQYIGE